MRLDKLINFQKDLTPNEWAKVMRLYAKIVLRPHGVCRLPGEPEEEEITEEEIEYLNTKWKQIEQNYKEKKIYARRLGKRV